MTTTAMPTPKRLCAARAAAAAALAATLLATSDPAAAADCGGMTACGCGDIVTADRILTADDPVTNGACAGTALEVSAGISLNLGGRTITCAPGGIGVGLTAASGLFGPGTITQCSRAVVGYTSQHGITVADVTAVSNTGNAFDFVSNDNTFLRNTAISNGGDGIFLVGSGNTVISNVLKENHRGAFIGGFGRSDNVVRRNRVASNTGAGLEIHNDVVSTTGENVAKNRIKGASDGVTPGIGLAVFAAGAPVAGNVIHGNSVRSYATGIAVDGTGLKISSNKAQDGSVGFVIDSESSDVLDNRAVGNQTGFDVAGDENRFENNVAKKQTGSGFDVTGSANTFLDDRAIKNGQVGFVLADVEPGDGNTLTDTRAKRNATCQYQIGDNNIDGGGNRANKSTISFGAGGGDFCP